MYALDNISSFHITDPVDTYVYDIVPISSGLVAISSDDNLRLLNPLNLNGPPIYSIRRVNTDVTCLRAIGDENAAVVCTAGRDGRVCAMDPRSGGKVGEARSCE